MFDAFTNVQLYIVYRFNFCSDLLRTINDPEHPLTLEELNVVDLDNVQVSSLSCYQQDEHIFQPGILCIVCVRTDFFLS